jgi:hypothetical protein
MNFLGVKNPKAPLFNGRTFPTPDFIKKSGWRSPPPFLKNPHINTLSWCRGPPFLLFKKGGPFIFEKGGSYNPPPAGAP